MKCKQVARWLIPCGMFVVALATTFMAAKVAGVDPLSGSSYSRFDSGHYLSIAKGGYDYFWCGGVHTHIGCGNAGWFPGYPMLIRAAHVLVPFLSWEVAGIVVSQSCFLFILLFVWFRVLNEKLSLRNVLILLFIGWYPNGIYFHVIFPYTAFLVCVLIALDAASKARWRISGVLGFLAATIYPIGFLFSIPLAIATQLSTQKSCCRFWRGILMMGFVLYGTFTVLLYMFISTGIWNTYLSVQTKYKYADRTRNPFHWIWRLYNEGLFESITIQQLSSLFTFSLLLICVALVLFRRISTPTRGEIVTLIYGWIYWLFLVTVGYPSFHRADLFLFPVGVLAARKMPLFFLIIMIILGGYMRWYISVLFFQGKII